MGTSDLVRLAGSGAGSVLDLLVWLGIGVVALLVVYALAAYIGQRDGPGPRW